MKMVLWRIWLHEDGYLKNLTPWRWIFGKSDSMKMVIRGSDSMKMVIWRIWLHEVGYLEVDLVAPFRVPANGIPTAGHDAWFGLANYRAWIALCPPYSSWQHAAQAQLTILGSGRYKISGGCNCYFSATFNLNTDLTPVVSVEYLTLRSCLSKGSGSKKLVV
jgi:hypothetical protein